MEKDNSITAEAAWKHHCKEERAVLTPMLLKLGYALNDWQPHLEGERYLMNAVTTTSGKKLILLGQRTSDQKAVVIKAARDIEGIRELEHERECRQFLVRINFAYRTFLSAEELLFIKRGPYTISVHAFIDQEKSFLDRPLEEQFSLALKAFKAQEGAHATTSAHRRIANRYFTTMDVEEYLETFKEFKEDLTRIHVDNPFLQKALGEAEAILKAEWRTIEQYCGFLTHVDFVPHNFRVSGGAIYLLDHSSLRFGNKYEGWARFLNFMTLYNPELEAVLTSYVRDNRTEEETLSLHLMRIYRLGEIMWYYTKTLERSEGDLHTLNQHRILFWRDVLIATLRGATVSAEIRSAYTAVRDSLRSDEEKKRQIGLH